MLKHQIDNLEEVDEAIRQHYTETKDGDVTVFRLQVEGLVPVTRVTDVNKKLSSFRSNNTRLLKLVGVMAKPLDIEVDDSATPEEVAEAVQAKVDEMAEAGRKPGKVDKKTLDEAVLQRTEQMRKDHEAALKAEQGTSARHLARLSALEINNAVLTSAGKIGMAEGAGPDIVARAREVFRYVDGKVVAYEDDGQTERYGADGQPLTISEWVTSLSEKDGKHLFKPNSGGGATGGSGGAGKAAVGPNPWKKDSWNATKQMQLIRTDRETAKRLAAEAGRPLPGGQ